MDILNKLYRLAEKGGIPVLRLNLPLTKALSLLENSTCYIGIDETQFETSAEKKAALAHELGHCKTGSFYNQYSPFDLRERHEVRADRWAIEEIIPRQYFNDAINSGVTEPWELAELFNVPQRFVEKAVEYYYMLDLEEKRPAQR
ncbi:ImmA/IrrE family metallo-endopeptidase [Bittarella massiliensis]|uniref:ImmA/IrrE family metallo-endopeptidase n=1 Tax=Bittarella massiliensis (ex Durand et al. 2017) TaxID=1720313 RepID=UPI00163D3C5D|nr:ImmA/IrrE family metallo-endopeptidase [Bittarella massiliensis (ex Durand et al. 2017)]MBC2871250.1 ImmA/IrrE family metallo-endopeptidase [Bittarella massiliensis (ex Durand et al. 2017)]